jgi:hypothetical protein
VPHALHAMAQPWSQRCCGPHQCGWVAVLQPSLIVSVAIAACVMGAVAVWYHASRAFVLPMRLTHFSDGARNSVGTMVVPSHVMRVAPSAGRCRATASLYRAYPGHDRIPPSVIVIRGICFPIVVNRVSLQARRVHAIGAGSLDCVRPIVHFRHRIEQDRPATSKSPSTSNQREPQHICSLGPVLFY